MNANADRLVRAVVWLQQATTEWAQQQGGYPAEIAPFGDFIAIASIDSDMPVLEVYVLEQVEHAIEYAERRPSETKMVAFGDGIAEWVDRQLTKHLEESN